MACIQFPRLSELGLEPAIRDDMGSLPNWPELHGLTNNSGLFDQVATRRAQGAAR